MFNEQSPCPCGSGQDYVQCCKRFHSGKEFPANALELMRARYSAYVLNLPDYIVNTTHFASHQYSENKFAWKRNVTRFSNNFIFKGLEILDFKENDRLATVTFVVHLTRDGEDSIFTERSIFEKVKDRWYYRSSQLAHGRDLTLTMTENLKMLPLAYYDDPILRKVAEPIGEINSEVRQLIDAMIETVELCDGIGLAAPQVFRSVRLFIIKKPIEIEKGRYDFGEIKVFIDPKISSLSHETWKLGEGCMSIPGLYPEVERAKELVVEYTNSQGQRIEEHLSGFEARMIQHENDHIDGILFIDRLKKKDLSTIVPQLQKINKRARGEPS